ncbi:MAG TPA: hypothetical protein VN930_05745 [Xanthobacteraceae bacterium]|nr:hypothetical protein [Xanthobacteraceae bacterium]
MVWVVGPFVQDPDQELVWTLSWPTDPGIQQIQAIVANDESAVEYLPARTARSITLPPHMTLHYQITVTTREMRKLGAPIVFYLVGQSLGPFNIPGP